MKKQIQKLLGVATLLTAAAASGQIAHQVRVTVPFSFMAGGKSSPAGEYRVGLDYTWDMLTLNSNKFKTLCSKPEQYNPAKTAAIFDFIAVETNGSSRPSCSMGWRRTCPSGNTSGK